MRQIKVQDVMTTEVLTAGEDSELKELAHLMHDGDVSGVPIVDEAGRLRGIVTEADLLRPQEEWEPHPVHWGPLAWYVATPVAARVWEEARNLRARDVMTRQVVTVRPDARVAEAVRTLMRAGVKRLPVVDEDRRVVGIVSRHDLLTPLVREDEELRLDVMDIVAETPEVNPALVRVSVDQGIVTLEGHVERRSDGILLARLANRVDGVIAVEDLLTFDSDDGPPRNDQEDRRIGEARLRAQERSLEHR
ncbi:MAG: CBS domain-containing protein [Actinomycetota bacterium]